MPRFVEIWKPLNISDELESRSASSCSDPTKGADCAHFVLNSNSLQLIPAYSSQSSGFEQTLAGVGLSEPE